MARIGILIIDDEKEIIKNLTKILSSSSDMEILGTASSGYEGVLEATLLQPDIVLMDCNMESSLCGIHASRVLLQHFPNLRIIILIDNEKPDLIKAAFKAGIVDYILKNASPGEIIKTIKEVNGLIHPKQQSITDKLYRRTLHPEGIQDSLMYTLTVISQLTPRELEIIKILLEGKNLQQISELSNLDIESVHQSTNNILNKFNKESIEDLIKLFKILNLTQILDGVL